MPVQKPLKILLNEITFEVRSNIIGIDMGQSFSKIAYIDDKELVLLIFFTLICISEIKNYLNSKTEQKSTFL
ncbi:MAG: hypothetical protein ACFE9T_12255 [Promethearchaeota archaeon]